MILAWDLPPPPRRGHRAESLPPRAREPLADHQIIDATGVKQVPLPPRSPNLNAYAERWVRSVKEECLAWVILFGEASLRHVLRPYVEHFHSEWNHQRKSNMRLFPAVSQDPACEGPIQCRERLGGLLKYYAREAA